MNLHVHVGIPSYNYIYMYSHFQSLLHGQYHDQSVAVRSHEETLIMMEQTVAGGLCLVDNTFSGVVLYPGIHIIDYRYISVPCIHRGWGVQVGSVYISTIQPPYNTRLHSHRIPYFSDTILPQRERGVDNLNTTASVQPGIWGGVTVIPDLPVGVDSALQDGGAWYICAEGEE